MGGLVWSATQPLPALGAIDVKSSLQDRRFILLMVTVEVLMYCRKNMWCVSGPSPVVFGGTKNTMYDNDVRMFLGVLGILLLSA